MKSIFLEFRSATSVWLGVVIALTVSQSALAVLVAAFESIKVAVKDGDEVASNLVGLPLFFVLIMNVFVILWVVSAALQQRSRQIALFVLQGASTAQLLLGVVCIVFVLFVMSTLLSCVIAPFVAPKFTDILLVKLTGESHPFVGTYTGRALLEAAIIGFVVMLVGVALTFRKLSRVEPIEALHAAQKNFEPSFPRLILSGLFAIGSVFLYILTYMLAGTKFTGRLTEGETNRLILIPLAGMLLMVIAMALAAPLLLKKTTEMLAKIPVPSVAWKIAGQQAAGRIQRQSSTIMPLVIGVSLFMTFSGLLNTMTHTMKIVAPGEDFHTAGIDVILVYLAPALIVALSGVVAGLLISARDRQLDFALIDISGADSWQLRAISCLDGFLMMVTAVFLSFVVVLISTLATSCALLKTVGVFSVSIQIRYWIVVFAVAALIGAVSTGIQGFKVNRDHSVELIAAAVGE